MCRSILTLAVCKYSIEVYCSVLGVNAGQYTGSDLPQKVIMSCYIPESV